ncbi:protein-disulfide reductase DsbD [Candidatus Hydrogenedentota bacterium]
MTWRYTTFVVVAFILIATLPGEAADDNFVVTSSLDAQTASPGEAITLSVKFVLGDGIHLYRDKLKFEWKQTEGVSVGKPAYPEPSTMIDPLDEEGKATLDIYKGEVLIDVPLVVKSTAGANIELKGTLYYQGCTDTVCFRPMQSPIEFSTPVTAGETVSSADEEPSVDTANTQAGDEEDTGNFFLRLVMAFGAGILISLTPCVYPMIPVTAAIIGGRSDSGEGRISDVLLRSFAYVLGLSIVYAFLGVLSASLGASFSHWLKTAWVLVPVSGIFVILALGMFDIIAVQTPAFIAKRVRVTGGSRGLLSVFMLGLVAGVVATPCVAAPLAGMLTFIATTGERLLGFWMLFSMAWGMGLLLIVVGTFSGSMLPKSGEWTLWLKKAFGFVFLWAAAYFLMPVIGTVIYHLSTSITLVAATVFLGGFDTLSESSGLAERLKRTAAIIALLFAAILFIDSCRELKGGPSASSQTASESAISFTKAGIVDVEAALASGVPTVLDFYADWCILCKELDRETLADPLVMKALSGINALKVDVDEFPELLNEYNIIGPPILVFIDSNGKEAVDLRVSGVVEPEALISIIDKLRKRT